MIKCCPAAESEMPAMRRAGETKMKAAIRTGRHRRRMSGSAAVFLLETPDRIDTITDSILLQKPKSCRRNG